MQRDVSKRPVSACTDRRTPRHISLLGAATSPRDESLRYILRNSDHRFIHRPLFVLPAPHTWEHVPGVTLLVPATAS